MYSIIIDINADRLYQTRQRLQIRSNVHERKPGEDESEKAATISVYRDPLGRDTTGSREL